MIFWTLGIQLWILAMACSHKSQVIHRISAQREASY